MAAERQRLAAPRRPGSARGGEMGRSEQGRRVRLNGVMGTAVLAAALLHAWTGLQVWQIGYRLGQARELTIQLEQQRQELQIEYAAATSRDRLEREAITRLGLEPATGDRVVHVAEAMAEVR